MNIYTLEINTGCFNFLWDRYSTTILIPNTQLTMWVNKGNVLNLEETQKTAQNLDMKTGRSILVEVTEVIPNRDHQSCWIKFLYLRGKTSEGDSI